MKKVWLMGGFGNVLFQILAYNVISKTHNQVSFVPKLTEQNSLTKFLKWTIHQRLYDDIIKPGALQEVSTLKAWVIVMISFVSKAFNKRFKSATFYSGELSMEDFVSNNVFGYFQDSHFLSTHREDLLKLGSKLRLLYASNKKKIVVHYRKGDSGWAVRFASYYDRVREMLKEESENILIVTDSIDDAKEFFRGIDNLEIISSQNALEDFKHLVSAKKIYCAPSTFSWWAAHSLDERSEVIMPRFFEKNLGVYVNKDRLTWLS